jgi:hypothetical protein
VGNWSEDIVIDEHRFKDFLKARQTGSLKTENGGNILAQGNQRVALTYRADGTLQSGDSVLLRNNFTQGVLVTNPLDKCPSSDDAYAVTTNPNN